MPPTKGNPAACKACTELQKKNLSSGHGETWWQFDRSLFHKMSERINAPSVLANEKPLFVTLPQSHYSQIRDI